MAVAARALKTWGCSNKKKIFVGAEPKPLRVLRHRNACKFKTFVGAQAWARTAQEKGVAELKKIKNKGSIFFLFCKLSQKVLCYNKTIWCVLSIN